MLEYREKTEHLKEIIMPNIKSAKKRVNIIEKKTLENKAVKSKILTYAKKFKAAVAAGDVTVAEVALKDVMSLLDKAVAANVIHANSAARKKAHYSKMLDDMKKSK